MILSSLNHLLFIKGRKVAGTSIEVWLSSFCGPEDIITPITPVDEKSRLRLGFKVAQNYGANRQVLDKYLSKLALVSGERLGMLTPPRGTFFNHMSLVDFEMEWGSIPDTYTIFAVDRCPYRKVISMANMQLDFHAYRKTGKVMSRDLESVKRQIDKMIDDGSIVEARNINLYKNKSGILELDIVRYENLYEDLASVLCQHKDMWITPGSLGYYKRGLVSESIDIEAVLTLRQISKINHIFFEEFETYGYSYFG